MVQNEAYGRPDGGELAPKTGTIKKIRLIAGGPGSFRPQIAKVKHSTSTTLGATKAKVDLHRPADLLHAARPKPTDEDDGYKVESFNVNIPVKKGQQLALRGNITSMIRCSSGGHNTLIYTPPLSHRRPLQRRHRHRRLLAPDGSRDPLTAADLSRRRGPASAGLAAIQPRSTWEPPTIASSPESPKTIQALLPPS